MTIKMIIFVVLCTAVGILLFPNHPQFAAVPFFVAVAIVYLYEHLKRKRDLKRKRQEARKLTYYKCQMPDCTYTTSSKTNMAEHLHTKHRKENIERNPVKTKISK